MVRVLSVAKGVLCFVFLSLGRWKRITYAVPDLFNDIY